MTIFKPIRVAGAFGMSVCVTALFAANPALARGPEGARVTPASTTSQRSAQLVRIAAEKLRVHYKGDGDRHGKSHDHDNEDGNEHERPESD